MDDPITYLLNIKMKELSSHIRDLTAEAKKLVDAGKSVTPELAEELTAFYTHLTSVVERVKQRK